MTPADLRTRVDAALRDFFDRSTPAVADIAPELQPLVDGVSAFVLDGGKRLRPSFCYWGFRAAGGDNGDEIVRAAAALELLQACALVHDDVIDRSETRRGAPSVHRRFAALHDSEDWVGDAEQFGVAAAVLLGDLALIWADAMLVGSGFAAEVLQRAMPVWEAMRVEVMCGQYLDVVEQARGGGSVDRALRVTRYKTAKYTIERPLHLGATLAGAPGQLVTMLSAYGLPLGEAFQLRDDLLGVYGDPRATGKPAGDDIREGKRTVLIALAEEQADDAQRVVLRRHVGAASLDDAGVDAVRKVLTATGAVARVEALINDRVTEAVAALDAVPIDADALSALLDLATAASRRSA